ncbi:MAG: tetratricopeptide repeat protein [Deltaproteobacteria bacterium]|nr:tetratricopeptide repeat protein [Deltaproteobacteria bacterium]
MTTSRWTHTGSTPVAAAICALLAAAVYSNTVTASFQFDDYLYVIDYCRTHGLESFFPPHGTRYLTYLTFALNYLAGGLNVAGYHIVNLSIHIINGVLVYLLAMSLIRSPRLAERDLPAFHIALLAALLFIAHPVQTEAVTYITQRFASLATLLYLLALTAYLKYRANDGKSFGAKAAFYIVALLSAYAAQVTKEISFTLPFVMLCVEFAFFKGPLLPRLIRLVPFMLAMAVIPWILFGPGTGSAIGGEVMDLQLKDLRDISRHDYLVTQFRVIMTYLRLLVLPVGQNIEYDYQMFHSILVPEVLASFVFICVLFFGAVYLFFRFLKGGGAYLALISAGTLWFFITISVESSIVPIKDLIFEHRLYLPAAGAAIVASAAVFFIAGRFSRAENAGRTLAAACVLLVLPLSVSAYMRNGVWNSEVTLYEDAVAKSPAKERVRYNLAWAYHRAGELDKAIEHYNEDLRLAPEKDKAHYNLGLIYRDRGEKEKAERHFTEALRRKPDPAGYYNLAMLYHSGGELDKAISSYEKAITGKPDYEDAHYNLGAALMDRGDLERAALHFSAVIRMNPASADALYNLGRVYAREGDRRRAALAFSEALRLKPGMAEARAELVKLGGGL